MLPPRACRTAGKHCIDDFRVPVEDRNTRATIQACRAHEDGLSVLFWVHVGGAPLAIRRNAR